MSEKIFNSKTYCKLSSPFAYATFTNFSKGKGLVTFYTDYGVFSSFWGAMGENTIEEFILSCDDYYLRNNLVHRLRYMGIKKANIDLVDCFLQECWPELKQIIEKEIRGENDTITDKR